MKIKKRIKLLKSQKILLQMKRNKIQEAIAMAQAMESELQATLNMIITEEHKVPRGELDQWRLSEDGQAIEWTKPEKPKKNKEKEE